MSTAYNFYLLGFFFFCLMACNPPKEKVKDDTEAKPSDTITTSTESNYVEKGTFLSDGAANTHYFLEYNIAEHEAEVHNRMIDSLEKEYEEDSTQLATLFVLGSDYATSVAFQQSKCDEAIELLSKVIDQKANYKSGAAYFNRAAAHLCKSNWEAATADINQYLEMDAQPAAFALLVKAKIALGQGNDEAVCQLVEEYKKAVSGSDSTLKVYEDRCE